MPIYELGLADEKEELDEKYAALDRFITTNTLFFGISSKEQGWLKDQRDVMRQYSEILGKRIAVIESPREP